MQKNPSYRRRLMCGAGLLALLLIPGGSIALAQDTRDASEDIPPGMVVWETATAQKVPVSPALLARGKQLYGIRCDICHGQQGEGNGPASLFMATAPRDFTRGIFKFSTRKRDGMPSDDDLFRTITTGFPSYGMPSFKYLSEDDRWALVYHVKTLVTTGLEQTFRRFMLEAEGEEPDPDEVQEFVALRMRVGTPMAVPPEPQGAKEDAVARGRKLYLGEVYACLKCHGSEGKGDVPEESKLVDDWGNPIRARDYTAGLAFRKVALRRKDTVRLLLLGVPGTPMPSSPRAETNEGIREAWDIAAYVEQMTAEAQRARN